MQTKSEHTFIKSEGELEMVSVVSTHGQVDFTGDPEGFKLWTESKRIQNAFQFDPLFAVSCSIVDPLPHQVEAVYQYLLPLPTIRFLLADDTGAGKTIMTGLLLKELISRDQLKRILIITPGGLTKQWQEDEMQGKFNMDFVLVDRNRFRSEPNVFSQADRVVTSIDFMRADDVLATLEHVHWDMVVVDECHKLSKFEYGAKQNETKRYKAAKLVSERSEHLLLLTATPHRGRRDTFRYLLQLLDPDIFATDQMVVERIQEYAHDNKNRFFIRRLKETMVDWNKQPLFKPRHTETIAYEMTSGEKRLYEAVTSYLTKKREEADRKKNTHVSLTLLVMQRRLTSSLYAIDKTLGNRYKALSDLLEKVRNNPKLLDHKHRLDPEFIDLNQEDYDDLSDDMKQALDDIAQDPRQARYFTTASSPAELEVEMKEVRELHQLSQQLRRSEHEEAKLIQLKALLREKLLSEQLGQKLVVFTEHRDTLDYLEEVLKRQGYNVVTIHGSKNVDERREAQRLFRNEADILIATDAAGEGINLQFCRLLINWDIPWNPNRLEQRMGRIHRYGQEHDVYVFNMVANNTREGKVLERLLRKLDTIREQMGSDKVYDVISDIFQEVSMDKILTHFLFGRSDAEVSQVIDERLTKEEAERLIKEREAQMSHSQLMYDKARTLKEASDEQRLQPRYVETFFKNAIEKLGGQVKESGKYIFEVLHYPPALKEHLRKTHVNLNERTNRYVCFDKRVFLNQIQSERYENLQFINPGNAIFDGLCQLIQRKYHTELMRGARFIDPQATKGYFAWVVESVILDARGSDSVADASIKIIREEQSGEKSVHPPSALVDLRPPVEYAVEAEVSSDRNTDDIVAYAYQDITEPQMKGLEERLHRDVLTRREYLEQAFEDREMFLVSQMAECNERIAQGNSAKAEEKLEKLQRDLVKLDAIREERLKKLDAQLNLTAKIPDVLGCAYVQALSEQQYEKNYGMRRDEEVEKYAMQIAIEYEEARGCEVTDVSSKRGPGYDLVSHNPETGTKKYIEVKGRADAGDVMLSENEWNRLGQLGDSAWLYVIYNCKGSQPHTLIRINDPANVLPSQMLSKGVQHLVKHKEIEDRSNEQ